MLKDRVEKRTLQRGDQLIILQGMIHVADTKFYELIKRELEELVQHGYQIFYEGWRGRPHIGPHASKAERVIADFLRTLVGYYEVKAEVESKQTQERQLSYPSDAIQADMPFAEIVGDLRRQGIFVSEEQLDLISNEYFSLMLRGQDTEQQFKKDPKFRKYAQKLHSTNLQAFVGKKLAPALITTRNQYLVDKVEQYLSRHKDAKVLIHYGNGHLPGITHIFERHGFSQVSVTMMSFQDEP